MPYSGGQRAVVGNDDQQSCGHLGDVGRSPPVHPAPRSITHAPDTSRIQPAMRRMEEGGFGQVDANGCPISEPTAVVEEDEDPDGLRVRSALSMLSARGPWRPCGHKLAEYLHQPVPKALLRKMGVA